MYSRIQYVLLGSLVVLTLALVGCKNSELNDSETKPAGEVSARIISDDGVNIVGAAGLAEKDFEWEIVEIRQGSSIFSRSQFQQRPVLEQTSDDQPQGSIILVGQSPDFDFSKTNGSIAIRFTFDPALGEQPDSQARYYPDGIEGRGYSSKRDHGYATVNLDAAEFGRTSVRLRGTFHADMHYGFSDKTTKGNNADLRNGRFDVVIPMVVKNPQVAASKVSK
ncbi:hypothetical protein N9Y42_05980 [Mariniblastus sp.]|nr:hypothetical protein [Mariniblastus sp.]MDB2686742.1 hypothetical protein [Mariniblastus sp.]